MKLAVADSWIVGWGIFQLIFSALVSFALFKLATAQRRYEGLEQRLHETTTKLVDERFRAMTHEVNGHVQGLISAVDEMKVRVKESEQDMEGLVGRGTKLEIALNAQTTALKDYFRENLDKCSTKADLDKHQVAMERKVGHIEQKLEEVGKSVAVLESVAKRRGA